MTWKTPLKGQKGFTLIEIAIVLIIIGLILGATVKGGDLIQSAKQKKFYNGFLKQWEITVLNYYDRTGSVLGDGSVNGGTNTVNGLFDNIASANIASVDTRLKDVGLKPPTTNTASSAIYTFKGQESGTQNVTMNLYYRPVTGGGGTVNTNTLYLTNMPTDLAIALDGIIDGVANGKQGKFRHYADSSDWPTVTGTLVVNAMYILDVP